MVSRGIWRNSCLGLMAVAVSSVFMACSDDEEVPEPRLEIMSPAAGERVKLDSELTVDVNINVRDFNVEVPGGCPLDSNDACGQVVLRIDGDTCNIPGQNYNSILFDDSRSIEANFALCPAEQRFGNHTIGVALRRQDGQAVVNGNQEPVGASITVITIPEN